MNNVFRIISAVGIAGLAGVLLLHYLKFGPKYPEVADDKRDIRRFSFFEIAMHCLTVLSFMMLALTGMGAVLCTGAAIHGWTRVLHIAAAPVFAFGLAVMSVRWSEDSRFALYDWDWAKKFGGYLGDKGHVDAGRFNGGQKAFFWVMCLLGILVLVSGVGRAFPFFDEKIQCLVLWLHRLSALCMIMGAIVHVYLGSVANPGTLMAVVCGKVSKRWSEHHHSIWFKELGK